MSALGKTLFGTVFSIAAVCLADGAHADISYQVGGWGTTYFPGNTATPPSTAAHVKDGQGYPGDAIAFDSYTGSLPLVPGISMQKINTLDWTVNWTYAGSGDPDDPDAGWIELLFDLNAARDMTVDGVTGSVSQGGTLEVNYDNDYLTLSGGPTTTFLIPGYRVDVTPVGIERHAAQLPPGDPSTWVAPLYQEQLDVMAQFEVTAVTAPTPEPSSLVAWSLLGVVLGGTCWWRRRRKP